MFEGSCEAQEASACGNLAHMIDDGRGIAKDRKLALNLHDKACTLGQAENCFTLGRAHQTGNGRERDDTRAIALLELTLALDPKKPSRSHALRSRHLLEPL